MKPKGKNQKLLIYAGIAGAIIGLIVLTKKKGESTAEEPAATYATSPSSIPAGSGETAGAVQQELGSFEQSLASQLPAAIASGVQAGLTNNSAGSGSNGNTFAETLSGLAAFEQATIAPFLSILGNQTGQQTGASTPSPSSGAPAAVASPAPAATAPPTVVSSKPQPAAPAYKDITCGNGCAGHKYADGHSECQTKQNGKCSW